jgi:small-conductance mechanosensitive channel/CRP-like cAMP-binding protein
MSVWHRLLQLTSASPFTGTWMSLGTAAGALLAFFLFRRVLPADDRQQSSATPVLLGIGLLLGLFRLVLVALGAHESTTGKVVSVLTTFFVALGAVNTVVMFVFEVLPVRSRMRLPVILRDLVQMLAFVVIVFGSLSQSGVTNFVSLITTSAVLTAVVGLALQSTIANLFAGIVLHMDRALGVGDWVQVGPRTGRIAQIRWRSTILRTTDGDTVILPNGQFTQSDVHNYSRPFPRHRVWLRIPFPYEHAPNEVRQVVLEATRSAPGVLTQPPPDVLLIEFAESAIIYVVRFWIEDFPTMYDVEGEVRTRIWYGARRAGLGVAYPTRNVRMLDGVPREAEDKIAAADRELDERRKALRQVDLFAPLEPAELDVLARGMRPVRFAAGESIMRQGDPGDSLFLITKGDVLVSIGAHGMNQSVTTLQPGSFFGEMSLVTGEPRTATCAARTDVLGYAIDHATLRPLLTTRPHLVEHLSSLLATRQAALYEKEGELSARAAHEGESKKRLLERIRTFFDLR